MGKSIVFVIISFGLFLGFQKENDISQINNYQENAKLRRVLLYSSISSDKPLSVSLEYEYDSLDRVFKVSTPRYENGEIIGTIKYDIYEYNLDGQLTKISNFNANCNSPSGFINLKNYVFCYNLTSQQYPQIKITFYFIECKIYASGLSESIFADAP